MFWKINPTRMKPYKKAYEQRIQYEAWLQGLYIRMAVGSCLPKGSKYPEKPLGIENSNENNATAVEKLSDAEVFGMWALQKNKVIKE